MKTFITLLIFAFSVTATAHQDIVSYEFGMRADVSNLTNVTVNLRTVTVDSEGLLTIKQAPLVFGGIEQVKQVIAQKQLSKETFENINSMVSSISHDKVIDRTNDFVCMLAVSLEENFNHLSIAREHNWQTGQYEAPMQVVHGPQGCWVSHSIYLEDPRANTTALRLKSVLRVLGLELI